MNTTKSCQKCGTELSDNDAQGLCPCCLLKVGLDTLTKTANLADGTAPPAPLRPLPKAGDRFGRFQILRELGRGGMGAVFEAEEQDTGRRVALKVISQRLASPENRARFLREGRLAASINHPNSVYVYSTEEIEGTPAIAMELVAGGTLQDRVNKSGPLAVSAAVDAILQIIAGLEAAQSIGILHRDIKPGNCFVDADGTVKIGDFGLSISSAARAEANVTAAGTLLGTPAFCSPEQLRGEELNARSDLYSVGGTLFYLLTGRAPFEGLNGPQLIANVLEKHAPSPRQFRKEIPTGLAGAILRCLEKQAGERFRSYDALRQALAPYSSAVSTPAPLGLRFLAGLLDNWFLGMIGMAVFMLGFGGMTIDASGHSIKWWTVGISFGLVSVLYFAIMEGLWGATLGKALCRLRVVGANNSPLGFLRGLARASLYTMLPWLPSGIWAIWVAASGKLPAILHGSAMMLLNHLSCLLFFAYLLFASLFCTMRRRNGFAAIHDLITRTRVITRKALLKRPVLSAIASPPPAVETNPQIGPYHVLGDRKSVV